MFHFINPPDVTAKATQPSATIIASLYHRTPIVFIPLSYILDLFHWMTYISSRTTPFCNIFLTFYLSSSNRYISCLIVLTNLWLIAGTELLVFTIQRILLDPKRFPYFTFIKDLYDCSRLFDAKVKANSAIWMCMYNRKKIPISYYIWSNQNAKEEH